MEIVTIFVVGNCAGAFINMMSPVEALALVNAIYFNR
jgi:hypothetical protein